MIFEADNVNLLYKKLIIATDVKPQFESAPRGKPIKEHIATQAVLTNPKKCLVTIAERKLNYRFAVIEKMEYLWGKHDADRLVAYNANLQHFKGTYGYFDGNYAQRIGWWLDHVYHVLKKDPDSRQGVINIYGSTDRHTSPDIPCTLSLQFILREGQLHLIATMRSNDLLWGFPYDINAFCFLQEVMACWLGVKMGNYYHNVGSTHIYLEPEENYRQLQSCGSSETILGWTNPTWDLDYEDTMEWLPKFFHMEARIRRLKQDEGGLLPPVLQEYLNILKSKWVK